MSENVTQPHTLLSVAEAIQYLDVPRHTLVNLRPHLHLMELPSGGHRYPIDYLVGVREALDTNTKDQRIVYAARDFSFSGAALKAADRAETRFSAATLRHTLEIEDSASTVIAATDLAEVLGVGRMSITDWQRSQNLPTVSSQRKVYIPFGAVGDLFTWQQPVSWESWERHEG